MVDVGQQIGLAAVTRVKIAIGVAGKADQATDALGTSRGGVGEDRADVATGPAIPHVVGQVHPAAGGRARSAARRVSRIAGEAARAGDAGGGGVGQGRADVAARPAVERIGLQVETGAAAAAIGGVGRTAEGRAADRAAEIGMPGGCGRAALAADPRALGGVADALSGSGAREDRLAEARAIAVPGGSDGADIQAQRGEHRASQSHAQPPEGLAAGEAGGQIPGEPIEVKTRRPAERRFAPAPAAGPAR